MFFVLSGYLITRIILSELQSTGTLSLRRFYERRARRLLPMLFFVVALATPFAWYQLVPTALVEYAESLLASIFFSSNFFFYFTTTEYGADSSLLKPFLHTWSLGVEEQFYFVFPIVTIILFKVCRAHFLAVIMGLSLISLQFSVYMSGLNSDLNFYLPFSRFWELAAGSILAYREINYAPTAHSLERKIFPIIGLYLIAYSVISFDSQTPHPSFHTLVPVLGTMLIIGFACKEDLVGKLLGSKLLVGIGLISYSAYLWHFPIFAFSRLEHEPENLVKAGLIILTLLLSSVTYHFIEKPFRTPRLVPTRALVIFCCASIAAITAFAAATIINDGFTSRTPQAAAFKNFEPDRVALRRQAPTLLQARMVSNPNFLDVKKKALIVGNSHSQDLFNALAQNNPVGSSIDFLRIGLNISCFDEAIPEFTDSRDAFYRHYNYKEATSVIVSTKYRESYPCDKRTHHTEASDLDGLKYFLQRARSDGKNVIVMGNTAEFAMEENMLVSEFIYEKYRDDPEASRNAESIREEANGLLYSKRKPVAKLNKKVQKIAKKSGVAYFDKVPLVCDEVAEICFAFTEDGFRTLPDYGHWTIEGAKFFGGRLLETEFFNLIK